MNPIQELKQKLDNMKLWQGTLVLNRNEYLNVKGKTNTKLYFVENGGIRIFVEDEQEENTVRFGYEGSFIAALDSFITGRASDFHMQAIRKSALKYIDKASYMDFINSDNAHLQLWQSIMEQLIFQQMEREIDLLISSPQERYQRVVQRSPKLFQEIPNKYIASYLRMSPETLSRIKKS